MRAWLVGLPFLWLLALVAAPVGILLWIALGTAGPGIPPFVAPLVWRDGWPVWQGTPDNLAGILADGFYAEALLRSLLVAGVSAVLCVLLGYPMALGIAEAAPRWRVPLLALAMLPVWTGLLPRLGAWIGLLRDDGWVNGWLRLLGLAPLRLLYADAALYCGMVHSFLPFAVLPLAVALGRRDRGLEAAAADLGASPWQVFRTVTLPLSWPAVLAAFLLVFIPAAGVFVIPELLGPAEAPLLGRVIWAEFFQHRDWPVAAALSLVLLAVLLLPIRLFQRVGAPR